MDVLRLALLRTFPRVAEQISDDELRAIIEEARWRFAGDGVEEDKVIDMALTRAAEVASGIALAVGQ